MGEIKEYPWIAPWLGRGGNADISSDMYSIGQLCSTISLDYLCPVYQFLAKTLTETSSFGISFHSSFGSKGYNNRLKITSADIRPLLKESSCSKCFEINTVLSKPQIPSSYNSSRLSRLSRPLIPTTNRRSLLQKSERSRIGE